MKMTILLALLISILQISCKKSNSSDSDPTPTTIEGKWRMIKVSDNETGLVTTKLSSIPKDVDIEFTLINSTSGIFKGNTPTNQILNSDFSNGINQTIIIHNLYMTKVNETSWGNLFLDNIRSSQNYSFETGGLLKLSTSSKTLTFKKL